MKIDILDETTIFKHLNTHKHAFLTDYYAFYSSWFGGITKDPRLMLVPLDDHMNHRGDGVFEAMKAAERSVYLMDEHLDRLLQSAEMIKIKTDLSKSEIKRIILETLQVADQNEAMIRIFLSRGPGSFSVNPYDTIGTQFYVAITAFKPLPSIKYQEGVAIGKSTIPLKSSWLATVKSCNYLPNVMMKKEAVDRNLEFVIGINQEDFLAEGPTENIVIIDSNDTIIHPEFDQILKGTTLVRMSELAKDAGMATAMRPISVKDLLFAKEVIMCGTTLDVLPVISFEGQPISDGKPGPIAAKLREMILNDIKTGPRKTPF